MSGERLRFATVAPARLLAAATFVVIASCSADGGSSTDPTASSRTAAGSDGDSAATSSAVPTTTLAAWEVGLSSVGGVDGPLMYGAKPDPNAGVPLALVVGELNLVDGCLTINDNPVLWPYGTRWQPEPPGVMFRNGGMLLVGEELDASGAYYSGPISDLIVDDASAELAERCGGRGEHELVILNG
jgi:hypothetical protein